jgi:hypothetical protein
VIKCSFNPVPLKGQAAGHVHCPECGEMVLVGIPHPDYSVLDVDEEPGTSGTGDPICDGSCGFAPGPAGGHPAEQTNRLKQDVGQ